MKFEQYASLSFWRRVSRLAVLPIIFLFILEFVWYALEIVIDPTVVSIFLYPVKFVILGLVGFCASRKNEMDAIGSAAISAITYFVATILEWLIIAPLFYPRLLFYLPGFSVVRALILGAICGLIGYFVAMSEYAEAIENLLPICNWLGARADSSDVGGKVHPGDGIGAIESDDLDVVLDDLEEHGDVGDQSGLERIQHLDRETTPDSIQSSRAELMNSLHLSFTLSPPYGPHNPQSSGNLQTISFTDGCLDITVFVQDDDGIPIDGAQITAKLEAGSLFATYPLYPPDYTPPEEGSFSINYYEGAELGNGHYLVSIPTRWRDRSDPEIHDFATGDLYQVIIWGEKEGYASSDNNIAAKFEVA